MNIEQLYRDYGIPYATEGHKHTREGWVNCECPFCSGNPGLHLGYDTHNNRFVCWRCGGKTAHKVLSALLRISFTEIFPIMRQYGIATKAKVPEKKEPIRLKSFKYPKPVAKLQEQHKIYLRSRNYDPEAMETIWGIMGTGAYAKLDDIAYKHRIIIPYVWDGRVVSFDSRDVTDKAQNKYMACPESRELIPRKQILYGLQHRWTETGICVEGAFDVWRLGAHAFATSGIKYTAAQVRLIVKTFKRVFIIYDNERQAQEQAKKLQKELLFRKVDCHVLTVKTDPDELTQQEANYLVKQLIN